MFDQARSLNLQDICPPGQVEEPCCSVMFLELFILLCCPYQDDRYLAILIPVDGSSNLQFPTHYKRFTLNVHICGTYNFGSLDGYCIYSLLVFL